MHSKISFYTLQNSEKDTKNEIPFSVLCYILKSTIFIPNEPKIPLIGIYQIKMSLHAHQQCWLNVYSSSIVKSLNLGTTQMPLNSR